MKTLSSFKGMRVMTEDGVMLGHLDDLRINQRDSRKRETPSAEIATFVYGMMGWLARLGIRSIEQQTIEWRDVLRIDGDRLVVRVRSARGQLRRAPSTKKNRRR